jgi:crossover junction endodeoxyribonuclease RusA
MKSENQHLGLAPLKVVLPWPDRKLNPNYSKGRHWTSTTDERKKARTAARVVTLNVLLDAGWEAPGCDVPLTIVFMAPDRRHRDRDNLLSALKPSLDGMADAMGVNDSQFNPITISREFGSKPGSVIVTIGRKA